MKRVNITRLRPRHALKAFNLLRTKKGLVAVGVFVLLAGGGAVYAGRQISQHDSAGSSRGKKSSAKSDKKSDKKTSAKDPNSKDNQDKRSNPRDAQQRNQIAIDRLKRRIDAAVKAKRLTQEQADNIIAKYDSLKQFRDDLAGKSKDEKTALRTEKRKELSDWAKQNNIPSSFLSGLI